MSCSSIPTIEVIGASSAAELPRRSGRIRLATASIAATMLLLAGCAAPGGDRDDEGTTTTGSAAERTDVAGEETGDVETGGAVTETDGDGDAADGGSHVLAATFGGTDLGDLDWSVDCDGYGGPAAGAQTAEGERASISVSEVAGELTLATITVYDAANIPVAGASISSTDPDTSVDEYSARIPGEVVVIGTGDSIDHEPVPLEIRIVCVE